MLTKIFPHYILIYPFVSSNSSARRWKMRGINSLTVVATMILFAVIGGILEASAGIILFTAGALLGNILADITLRLSERDKKQTALLTIALLGSAICTALFTPADMLPLLWHDTDTQTEGLRVWILLLFGACTSGLGTWQLRCFFGRTKKKRKRK